MKEPGCLVFITSFLAPLHHKKKAIALKAMVLLFSLDSREISFRLDDCPSQKIGRLLPIGVQ
jgi:hypothetical protein